jgi:hypothetical protein
MYFGVLHICVQNWCLFAVKHYIWSALKSYFLLAVKQYILGVLHICVQIWRAPRLLLLPYCCIMSNLFKD